MTIRELYRDDILGRFGGHSFVETVIGSTTRVEFRDAGDITVAESSALAVDDAYAVVRQNMVGGPEILPRLTESQRDALTGTVEGTALYNTDAENEECFQVGSWTPTNPLFSGDPTFLGSVKIGGDTSIAPNGAMDIVGTNAATARIRSVRHQASANGAAALQLGHSRGTEDTPVAMESGDRLGQIIWTGDDGVTTHGPGPVIRGVTSEAWSDSAKGSRLTFETIPNGATSEALALTLSEHGYPQTPSYTVVTLPPVGDGGGFIFVSDETGGATMAFSDGTNWRRVQDRAIVA